MDLWVGQASDLRLSAFLVFPLTVDNETSHATCALCNIRLLIHVGGMPPPPFQMGMPGPGGPGFMPRMSLVTPRLPFPAVSAIKAH